jgi:hypothetical protein
MLQMKSLLWLGKVFRNRSPHYKWWAELEKGVGGVELKRDGGKVKKRRSILMK